MDINILRKYNKMGLERVSSKTFASLVGGRISIKAEEGADGAVKREYETSSGDKGVKWEYLYNNLRGNIQSISFVTGDYGDQIQVVVNDVHLSINTNSSFGSDLMKKLPNLNLEEEVNLIPWKMEKDGKIKSGLAIHQGTNQETGDPIKISDYFYDWDKKESLHDLPQPEKENKEMDSDDWKIYFLKVKKFLVDYTVKNIIPNAKFTPFTGAKTKLPNNDNSQPEEKDDYTQPEDDGVELSQIPF